jgi:hypothetical protein
MAGIELKSAFIPQLARYRDFLSEGRPENMRDKRRMRGKGLRTFLGCRVGANEAIA